VADGDWPEFSIPDVGNSEAEPAPAAQPGVPSGSAPAAPAPAPLPGTQAAGGGPSAGDDDRIPKYRFDEANERARQADERFNRAVKLLEMEIQHREKPVVPPAELDEEAQRKQRLFDQLMELDPRLKRAIEVAERADELFATADQTKQEQERQKAEWDRVAVKALSSVHDAYAVAAMGKGKTGKDLPVETRQSLTDNFVAWVMQDPTGTRTDRYNQRDPALASEFVSDWSRRFVEPFRRQTAAGQVAAARRTANLPVGGGASNPLGTPPPKTHDDEDEDAIFHRAFKDSMDRVANS
jgi:hypothetical protein